MKTPSSHRRITAVATACAVFAVLCWSAWRGGASVTVTFDDKLLGRIEVVRPAMTPNSMVYVISDRSGITPRLRAFARQLADHGSIVVPLDLGLYESHLEASARADENDECHYLTDDLKDTGQEIQRTFGVAAYLWPIAVGFGEGATLAYGAVSQAPANTIAGAISIDMRNTHHLNLPLCPGAKNERQVDGSWTLGNDTPVPAPWFTLPHPDAEAATQAFAKPLGDAHVMAATGERQQVAATVAAIRMMAARGDHALGDLPLSLIRPKGKAEALAIIISGDGGWRDIDMSLGERLSDHGVAVIGLDSLRYFWREKDPQVIAADITRMIDTYGSSFPTHRIMLAGYSFGADILPFVWPALPERIRDRISVISLIGLEPTADFRITVNGYLGRANDDSRPVLPAIHSLPLDRVLCVYGEAEASDKETACIEPELAGAELIRQPGGHHFDGDYASLADKLYQGLARRQLAANALH